MSKSLLRLTRDIFAFSPLLLLAALATKSNLSLTGNPSYLFMDEQITFSGVKTLFDANSAKVFLYQLFDGGDQRYGRILWNSLSVSSYFPYLFFGDQGLIFSNRLFQTLVMIGGICLIIWCFVRSWIGRFTAAVFASLLPDSTYFLTMPKPEPQLVLCLGISLLALSRSGGFSSFGYFMLGAALGAKISALPIALIFILYFIRKKDVKFVFRVITAFCFGLSFSVPILLPSVLLVTIILKFFLSMGRFDNHFMNRISIDIFLLVSILVLFYYLKVNWNPYYWLNSTILNTSHGSDSKDVGVVRWVQFVFFEWFANPRAIFLLMSVILVGVFLLFFLWSSFKNNQKFRLALLLILSGIIANTTVFISASRLWGYYLYVGTLLVIIGVIALLEIALTSTSKVTKIYFFAGITFLVTVSSPVLVSQSVNAQSELKRLAGRDLEPGHRVLVQDMSSLLAVVESTSKLTDRPLTVMVDPLLYLPPDSEQANYVEIWGPWLWNHQADILYLGPELLPESFESKRSQVNFRDYVNSAKGFRAFVLPADADSNSSRCSKLTCFRVVINLKSGGKIMVRDSLLTRALPITND